jgi:hypothetical protein
MRGISLSSCLRTRQVYRTQSLHPPGNTLTAAVLRRTILHLAVSSVQCAMQHNGTDWISTWLHFQQQESSLWYKAFLVQHTIARQTRCVSLLHWTCVFLFYCLSRVLRLLSSALSHSTKTVIGTLTCERNDNGWSSVTFWGSRVHL